MTDDEWVQIGTVEIVNCEMRLYPLDPYSESSPLQTWVAVEPGVYPVMRKFDAIRWLMRGRVNERVAKIGDGLFELNNGDKPTGLEVQFPSQAFGPEQFAEFLTDPLCQPGPAQRLKFDLAEVTL